MDPARASVIVMAASLGTDEYSKEGRDTAPYHAPFSSAKPMAGVDVSAGSD
jgi:hypothetical protein